MKNRILPVVLMAISATSAMAQNEDDAIRYSNIVPLGTAKFISMGGAMGAIGGDMSAISINPAGVAVYRNDQLSFSPMWNTEKAKTKYCESNSNANTSSFKFSNVGFVSVFHGDEDFGIASLSIGMVYNRLANFEGGYVAKGYNNQSSMLDKEVDDFNADVWYKNLFYQSNLFFFDSTNNIWINDYESADLYGSNQRKSVNTSGSLGEYSFSIGLNLNDKYYIGGSLNIVSVNYKQTSKYIEIPVIEDFAISNFAVTDEYTTSGTGLNMKLGFIGWLTDNVRVGAAFHTPTILNLSDDYGSCVESDVWFTDNTTQHYNNKSSGGIDWNMYLPAKFMGSVAFVVPQRGLIDVDCEIVNYSATSLNDDDGIDDTFEDVNNHISDIYRTTMNLRVGGELTFGPMVARGGFGFYGSPYKSEYENSSANRKVYSLGVGYRSKHFSFDVGYSLAKQKSTKYLYSLTSSAASLKKQNSALVMTLGFRL